MAVNKVEFEGKTLIDLTGDTVTPETLKRGVKAHNRAGEQIIGVMPEYPVGYIYLSAADTSPAELFGGTWEKIEGKFLLATSSAHAVGTTGGEEFHKLTVQELPDHGHKARYYRDGGGNYEYGYWYQGRGYLSSDSAHSSLIEHAGGDAPHNNMPPFLAVNMWKRIF